MRTTGFQTVTEQAQWTSCVTKTPNDRSKFGQLPLCHCPAQIQPNNGKKITIQTKTKSYVVHVTRRKKQSKFHTKISQCYLKKPKDMWNNGILDNLILNLLIPGGAEGVNKTSRM